MKIQFVYFTLLVFIRSKDVFKLPWLNRDSDYENQIVFSKAVQDLNFNRLDSLTDSLFDDVLNRKCSIGLDALARLKLYYQSQNITYQSCYNELIQFDKDLNDGNYYAKRICDSWGEDFKPSNTPGLQFSLDVSAPTMKNSRPGLIDQCRSVSRPVVSSDTVPYQGKYFTARHFTHGFKNNPVQWVENFKTLAQCYQKCEKDDECLLGCSLDFYGNGTFKTLDYYEQRGICYPSSCGAAELLIVRDQYLILDLTKEVSIYRNEGENGQWTAQYAYSFFNTILEYAPRMERVYFPTFLSFVLFYGILLLVIFVASIVWYKNKKNSKSNLVLAIFAYQPHWEKLISSKRSSKAIKCIDGIRALSIMWVVLGHCWTQLTNGATNASTISYHLMTGSWSPIYNATQSVDSFFLIGAVLLSYLSTDKIIAKFNSVSNFVRGYILYLVSRYVRLIPVILFTAWAIVSVLPPIPDGIFVNAYGQRLCETRLWESFFFLSGWLQAPDQLCNGVQWYLSCDYFYYAIFPFICILYGKNKAIGITVVCLLSFGSWLQNFFASLYTESFIAQTFKTLSFGIVGDNRWMESYLSPWARYHSHGVGLLFGWFILHEQKTSHFRNFLKRHILIEISVILLTWTLAIFALYFVTYGIDDCFQIEVKEIRHLDQDLTSDNVESYSGCFTNSDGSLDWIAISIWNASFRILWCVGLGLLITLCFFGYGFGINWFLSSTPLLFIAKISYSIYIFHFNIIFLFMETLRMMPVIDWFMFGWIYSGIFCLSSIVATILYLTIEAPFATMWTKVLAQIMGSPKISKISEKNVNDKAKEA